MIIFLNILDLRNDFKYTIRIPDTTSLRAYMHSSNLKDNNLCIRGNLDLCEYMYDDDYHT